MIVDCDQIDLLGRGCDSHRVHHFSLGARSGSTSGDKGQGRSWVW